MPAQIYNDQTGNRYILEGGRYRPVTEQESATLDRGFADVAAESAVNTVKAAGYAMLGLGARTPLGAKMTFPKAMDALEQQGELSNLRPGAAGFGSELPLAAGGVLATRMGRAGRGAAKAARSTPNPDVQRITPETSQLVEDLGSTVQAVSGGPDSAGAAARTGGLWDGLRRMPKFRDFLDNMEGLIAAPRPLTAGQQKMLQAGEDGAPALADRVGFQFLPGQRNGNGVIAEAIRRDPAMSDAFDHILVANSNNLMERAARAQNLDPGAYGRDIRQLGRGAVGEQFDEVQTGIGNITLADDVQSVLDNEVYTVQEARTMEGLTEIGGQDVMDVRRLLSAESAAAHSDPTLARRARTLDQALDTLDDQIEGAIDDPALLDVWRDARSRWRVVRAFDRQGVITRDGDISVKTLVGALEREFEREFRRSEIPRGEGLPQDVIDLLEYTRVAGNYASNLNDSGTATGNAIIGMVTNPGQYAKKRVAAKFITDYMLSRPDLAEAMPQ